MFSRRFLFFLCLALLSLCACKNTSSQPAEKNHSPKDSLVFSEDKAGLTLPDGFQVVKVVENIGAARRVVVRDNGDMYVSLNARHHGHPIVALRDTSGNGKADLIKYFGDLGSGTGMRIHDDYLYYGSDTAVVRYKLNPKKLLPNLKAELVASLPKQNVHEARSLAFDNNGNMYVNIGVPSNNCQVQDRRKGSPGQDPCPLLKKHGAIWQFKANSLNQTQNDGSRYVTGIRNCVALDWNPNSRKLYAVMHGRDQLHTLYPEYYSTKQSSELPAEEFLLFKKGANYGWPYTYWDPYKKAFVIAPEYGGNGKKTDTSGKYEKPIMSFPGHWAPNGLLFYTGKQFPDQYQNGAFVAFHGSWNRAPEPQKGFKIIFVPFNGNLPSGDYTTFADGFAGSSKPIESPGDAKYRPCGIGQGPDGSLYVSDDAHGTIFRIVYTRN